MWLTMKLFILTLNDKHVLYHPQKQYNTELHSYIKLLPKELTKKCGYRLIYMKNFSFS